VIDVVIPVYNAAADLARCVESVLACTKPPYRLVLVDDGSPDPAIRAYFAALARQSLPHVVLLGNDRNLGFTGTANRGMRMSDADVVLLNSDTVVTAGWLDALARCAASDRSIGTVTPFSNNAEICSFPRFCEDNPWPSGADPEPVRAALAQAAVPTYPELPTGVGFCLYIRRALITAVGVFDPAFGLGYGEENDLCLRAARAGFRNVLCDDAFVLHLGGRSFEGQKATLGARNLELVVARHPRYLELVRDYIAADPLRPIRNAALARQRVLTGPARGVLHVIRAHGSEGGRFACALFDASRERCRHYVALAVDDAWRLEEWLDDGATRTYEFRRGTGEPWAEFLGGLCATFGVGLVHLHDISGCRDGILAALAGLDLRYSETPLALPATAPFDRPRVRDALGYVPWTPPPLEVAAAPAASIPTVDSDPRGTVAQAALRLRQTLPGRVLYRLTPARVRRALKSCLR
jgi:O-antigen biosynthesis protein